MVNTIYENCPVCLFVWKKVEEGDEGLGDGKRQEDKKEWA